PRAVVCFFVAGDPARPVRLPPDGRASSHPGERYCPRHFRYDRVSVWVPLSNDLATFNSFTVFYSNQGAIRNLITFTFATARICNRQFTGTRYSNEVTGRIAHHLHV